jgi:nitroreductase
LSLNGLAGCLIIERLPGGEAMEFSKVIASRRSIRKFTAGSLSAETIQLLLEAARLAPSGSNLQPWRFIVAQSPSAKEALAQCTPYKFIANAAVIFVCCADLTALSTRGKRIGELLEAGAFEGIDVSIPSTPPNPNAPMDEEAARAYLSLNVAIAVEHVALAAVDLGLGSCWIGRFDKDKVRETLSLEEAIHPVALLPVGHSDQSPEPRPRLGLDKLVLKTI